MTDTFWLFNQLGGVVLGLALCALGATIILFLCRLVWCLVWEAPRELLLPGNRVLLQDIGLLALAFLTFFIILLAFVEPVAKILLISIVLPSWLALGTIKIRNWRRSKIHKCALKSCKGWHRSHA
jgi:hypothetical protein